MKSLVDEPVQTPNSAPKRGSRPQPTCVLCIGDQQLPAAIVEERGGTMHIVVQGSPQFWVEDDGTLKTPDGEFSVRVFNIVREEPESEDPVGDIPTFRVGLERLGQIDCPEDPDEMDHPEEETIKTEAAGKSEKKSRVNLLSVLTLAMVAAVSVGAFIVWQTHFSNWDLGFGLTGANKSADGKPGSVPNAEQSGIVQKPEALRILSELSGLPGAVPFAQPELAKKLELTPNQMDAIQRLNKITLEAVNDLEKYWGSGDRFELAQKRMMLLNEARQQALLVLTDPQLKLWDEITK